MNETIPFNITAHPNKDRASNINNLVMPFFLYFGSGLFLFLGFCFLREKFKIFYMPRRRLKKCAPPRIPSGFFSWIMVVLRLKTSYVLPIVGVDAEVFLLFLKMAMKLFLTIGIISLVILVPINYQGNANSEFLNNINHIFSYNNNSDELSADILFINHISISNIPDKHGLLSFHIIFTWVFSIIVYFFLFKYYSKCREIRIKYIQNCYNNNYKQLVNFRSIIIFGLPREYRNEEALYNFFTDLGIGDLEKVVICKKYLHLRKALDKREKYLKKIESYYTNWIGYRIDKKKIFFKGNNETNDEANDAYQKMQNIQNMRPSHGNFKKMSEERINTEGSMFSNISSFTNLNQDHIEPRYDKILIEYKSYYKKRSKERLYLFGDNIDLLNYYVEKFVKWDNNVKKLRKKTKNSSTPVGFVTFKSPLSALIGAQCLLNEKPFTCFVSLAPEPRDIYWKNISNRLAQPYTKLMRAILVVFISIFIVIIWFIPVTFLMSIFHIEELGTIIPFIGDFIKKYEDNTTWRLLLSLIDSGLTMIVLATWLSFLPDILMFLSEIQGIETYSWLEQSLLNKYFFYQIFNVLFVFVIGSLAIKSVGVFINVGKSNGMESINEILEEFSKLLTPMELIKVVGNSLASLSPFYINYIMLQSFLIISIQLIYPAPIAKGLIAFALNFIGIRKTPRAYSDLSDPRSFSLNYGYISTLPLVLFTITLTFSCICPIIPLMGTIYFAYSFLVYKYQLLYIQHPRYESYGSFVPLYINRCLFGLLIFQITMFGELIIKYSVNLSEETLSPYGIITIFPMAPLILATYIVYKWFKQSFEKHFKFIPLEVASKRLHFENIIVNSNTSTMKASSSTSSNDYTYCSYCGSHNVVTSKTPINKPRSNSNSSLKDISSALRKRPSFDKDYSSCDLYASSSTNNDFNIKNNENINTNNYLKPNKYEPTLKYNNKNISSSDLQDYNIAIEKLITDDENNIKQNKNNQQNKGKSKSAMLNTDELTSEESENSQINHISYQSGEFIEDNNKKAINTQKINNGVSKLNMNFKNKYDMLPSPLSGRSGIQSNTDESMNTYVNTPLNGSALESPYNIKPRHRRKESNILIRDKYSSRKWIFDQYTDYHQPRSFRVNGISDIPWDVYQLNGGYLNINDEQLYSYEHPAVVGPLPTLWLTNKLNNNKGEEIMESLIKEYKRIHYNDLHQFENEDEEFNNRYIEEEIECDNDHPQWIKNINKRIYRMKKKVSNKYNASINRYVDYVVQWLNFGLR